jgi:hypothetical protein
MRKKPIAIYAILGFGLGLLGTYLWVTESAACDNYCFAPGFPDPPLLPLWVMLFLAGSVLGLIALSCALVKQAKQRQWVWLTFTLAVGLFGCIGFLFALIGALHGVFILLFCDIYLLIYLIVVPEVPQYAVRSDAPVYQKEKQ